MCLYKKMFGIVSQNFTTEMPYYIYSRKVMKYSTKHVACRLVSNSDPVCGEGEYEPKHLEQNILLGCDFIPRLHLR